MTIQRLCLQILPMIRRNWHLFFLMGLFSLCGYSIYSSLNSDACLPGQSGCIWSIFVNLFFYIIVINVLIIAPFSMIFMAFVLPIGGCIFIYNAVFERDDDCLWNLLLGTGLLTTGYFFTTKVSIPVIIDTVIPKISAFASNFL